MACVGYTRAGPLPLRAGVQRPCAEGGVVRWLIGSNLERAGSNPVPPLILLLLRVNQRQTHTSVICMSCGAAGTRVNKREFAGQSWFTRYHDRLAERLQMKSAKNAFMEHLLSIVPLR